MTDKIPLSQISVSDQNPVQRLLTLQRELEKLTNSIETKLTPLDYQVLIQNFADALGLRDYPNVSYTKFISQLNWLLRGPRANFDTDLFEGYMNIVSRIIQGRPNQDTSGVKIAKKIVDLIIYLGNLNIIPGWIIVSEQLKISAEGSIPGIES